MWFSGLAVAAILLLDAAALPLSHHPTAAPKMLSRRQSPGSDIGGMAPRIPWRDLTWHFLSRLAIGVPSVTLTDKIWQAYKGESTLQWMNRKLRQHNKPRPQEQSLHSHRFPRPTLPSRPSKLRRRQEGPWSDRGLFLLADALGFNAGVILSAYGSGSEADREAFVSNVLETAPVRFVRRLPQTIQAALEGPHSKAMPAPDGRNSDWYKFKRKDRFSPGWEKSR